MPFTNGVEAQQIQTDKFFMVLTLISLRPILSLSEIRFLLVHQYHHWMMCSLVSYASPLLRPCRLMVLQIHLCQPLKLTLEKDVVAIGVKDNVLSAPIVISLVILKIVAISYMDDVLALPTLLSHLILCYLDLTLLRAPHLRVSPLLVVIMMPISDIKQPHQPLLLLLYLFPNLEGFF